MLFYVRAYQSVVALDTGEWQTAAQWADIVLRYPWTSTVPRWWSARSCRYAAALSLLDAGDAASIRHARRMLNELGARGQRRQLQERACVDVADTRPTMTAATTPAVELPGASPHVRAAAWPRR